MSLNTCYVIMCNRFWNTEINPDTISKVTVFGRDAMSVDDRVKDIADCITWWFEQHLENSLPVNVAVLN